MQIIVDDHTEMKYYKRCLEQINNKYSLDAEINKCTVIDICNLCIETLVQDFITLSLIPQHFDLTLFISS